MAVELVGGALLSSVLQVAFDRLASRDILDYFRRRKLNETLLKRLNITLRSINAVIDDAEDKEIRNESVKAWVAEVKDAVFDAEDLLEEIDSEISKRKQLEADPGTSKASSKVWNFFSATLGSFDKELEARMKQVLDNLEYLASHKDILGLRDGGSKLLSQRMPSTSLVDKTVIYGRDDDKEIIIKWLLSDNDNRNCSYSIISVVGMGGMGKTTLAQLVYNDQGLKDEFDLKAWVCVSEEFDLVRVTRMILEAITLASDDTKELNILQIRLKEKLSGKKFLLVLDDVWNENHMQWEALQTPFIYGAQGSKVVVTTRSDKVASAARSSKIHLLMQLLEESSWLLFAKYAFHDKDPQSYPDLEEIGRRIVMKCNGLPLALKAIGSLLYTKSSYEEWNGILTSEMWDMSNDTSDILPALRLSYSHLPAFLKRCFAYCSLFPKGYAINKEHLVQLWMAESLLPFSQQNKSMKEVGDLFFQDLLARSFFQRSSENKARFLMHDLFNDLAKYISGVFCYRLEVEEALPQTISKMTRYFSYSRHRNEVSKRFEAVYRANRLRTFLPLSIYRDQKFRWISSEIILDLLTNLKCLRVLSLSGYKNIIELPDSLGNFKHLRYLNLSSTGVKKLPDSTCLLYNLQTLKLRCCESLVELPSDLHKLINLQHLDIQKTKIRKMPEQLGKLNQLQVLTSFCVGTSNEIDFKQLGELNLWGELSILELQNVSNPLNALAANLKSKLHLEKLRLEWSMDNDESQKERDVLEKLQPHKNLKELCVKYYGGTRFPNWFGDNSLRNLVSLKLHNCKYCYLLPPLGLLRSLKALSVMGFSALVSIGPEFYGNISSTIPFGSLEILKFENMWGWEEWECQDGSGAFPCLQTLHLRNCPRLKEQLPKQLSSLNSLFIENCQQLVSSVPQATAISHLTLKQCGKLQLSYAAASLKILKVTGSHMEGSLLENIQHTIANSCLERLEIVCCLNMEFFVHHCHNFLISIFIRSSCATLETFPLNFFPKLQGLWLEGCSNLEMISVSEGNDLYVTSITWLVILKCPKFVSFSKEALSAPKLEWCRLENLKSLKSLPECMHSLFPSLEELILRDCSQLESFPDGGLPSNLKTLLIYNCPKLVASRMKWGLQIYSSLDHFSINDANVESLPDEGLLPPSLTSLSFYNCSKLKILNYKGLCHLSSLKQLILQNCPRLDCLPKEGLPSFISTLEIVDCPLLKQRCQKRKGKDWEKIACIQCVRVDDEILT